MLIHVGTSCTGYHVAGTVSDRGASQGVPGVLFHRPWSHGEVVVVPPLSTSLTKFLLPANQLYSTRGVMVIKQAAKTRAAQRKGALTNWKKTGRTIIKYLRCRHQLN